MLPVTHQDVLDARCRVHAVLKPTALYEWPALSELLGCRFHIKHENHQPVGAFKVRGGINLVGTLSDEERAAGILACSTGNHGQSLAWACRRFGVECTVVVPEGNNPDKNRAIPVSDRRNLRLEDPRNPLQDRVIRVEPRDPRLKTA